MDTTIRRRTRATAFRRGLAHSRQHGRPLALGTERGHRLGDEARDGDALSCGGPGRHDQVRDADHPLNAAYGNANGNGGHFTNPVPHRPGTKTTTSGHARRRTSSAASSSRRPSRATSLASRAATSRSASAAAKRPTLRSRSPSRPEASRHPRSTTSRPAPTAPSRRRASRQRAPTDRGTARRRGTRRSSPASRPP